MKRKVHKTKTLKAGKSFSIACKTPTGVNTLHAYDDSNVTCKRCQVVTSLGELARGARAH